MGLDEPTGMKKSLPGDVMPNTKVSGGDMPLIREPGFNGRMSSGLDEGLAQLGAGLAKMANKMKEKEEEDKERDRAVQFAKLQSSTIIDDQKSWDSYKANYKGKTSELATGYNEEFKVYGEQVLNTIQDKEVRARYQRFLAEHTTRSTLRGLMYQNDKSFTDFRTNFQEAKKSGDDAIRAVTSRDNLMTQRNMLQEVYDKALQNKLQTMSLEQQEQAKTEIEQEQFGLTYTYLMTLAKDKNSPVLALAELRDPSVNSVISGPKQDQIRDEIQAIIDKRNTGYLQQAKALFSSWEEAAIAGKDPAVIVEKWNALGKLFNIPEAMVNEMKVKGEIYASYADLRNNMLTMSDSQFDEALESRDPANNSALKADENYSWYVEAHDKVKEVLKAQRALMDKTPVKSTMEATGATDPETAMLQYVHGKLANGANVYEIRPLDPTMAEPILNSIHNAVAGGKPDAAIQVYNDLKAQFAPDPEHPERQIIPNVDLLDVVLAQLGETSKHPLDKRMISAFALIPDGETVNASNSFLIQAAFITNKQRAELVQTAGLEPAKWATTLNAELEKTFPEWRLYFQVPPEASPRFRDLLVEQKHLMMDMILLSRSSGQFTPSGGLFGIGETSATTNAAKSVIESLIPYKPMTLQGNPVIPGAKITQPGGGIGYGNPQRKTDMFINASELIVPKEIVEKSGKPVHLLQEDLKVNLYKMLTDSKFWDQNISVANTAAVQVDSKTLSAKIYDIAMPFEREFVANDSGQGPSSFGIQYRQYPHMFAQFGIRSEADASKLTEDQARQIQHQLFMASPAAGVKDPRLASLIFDARFMGGWPDVAAKVPDWQTVKNLPPTAENIPKLDAMYKKLETAWIDTLKTYKFQQGPKKGQSQWAAYGAGWTKRINELSVKSAKLRMELMGGDPVLKAGQAKLREQAMKLSTSNLYLKNSADLNGVEVMVVENGRKKPLPGWDGRPVMIPWSALVKGSK